MKFQNEEKKKILSGALQGIDSCFLEESLDFVPSRRAGEVRRILWRALPVAACLCLVVAVAFSIYFQNYGEGNQWQSFYPSGNEINNDRGGTDSPAQTGETGGITGVTNGEVITPPDFTHFEVAFPLEPSKYLMGFQSSPEVESGAFVSFAVEEITSGEYASYEAGHVIDESLVGEYLGQVEVKTYWWDVLQKMERDTVNIRAVLYSIKNVATDSAVCVRYLDEGVANTTTHFYIYSNPAWGGTTLEGLYSAYDFDTHLSIWYQQAFLYERSGDGEERKIKISFAYEAWNAIRAELLSLTGERLFVRSAEELDAYIQGSVRQGQIYLKVNTLNNRIAAMQIFDNGYLMLVSGGRVFLFEIGAERVDALLQMIEDGKQEEGPARGTGAETTTMISPA